MSADTDNWEATLQLLAQYEQFGRELWLACWMIWSDDRVGCWKCAEYQDCETHGYE